MKKKWIIDTHCDALLKLSEKEDRSFNHAVIDTNVNRLLAGGVSIQFFAIFIEPWIKQEDKFTEVLKQIKLFNEKIIKPYPFIRHLTSWQQIDDLKEGEIGSVLTIEGLDAIGNEQDKLMKIYEAGVLSVGLTWNEANLCADGIGEPRGAGLTAFGKKVITLNDKRRILTDVSHLSVKGFWDVLETAKYPFASHSNAKAICDHHRNLDDQQIDALIARKSFIGLVFYPIFLNGKKEANIADLLRHIDYICERGGVDCIGFGSDFDGIEYHMKDLQHSGHYKYLENELLKHYKEEYVEGFLGNNFKRFISMIC